MNAPGWKHWLLATACLLGLASRTSAQCSGDVTVSGQNFSTYDNPCTDFDGTLTWESINLSSASSLAAGPKTLSLGRLQNFVGHLEFNDIRMEEDVGRWTVEADSLSNVTGNLTFAQLDQFEMPDLSTLSICDYLAFNDVVFASTATIDFENSFQALNQVNSLDVTNTNLAKFGPLPLELAASAVAGEAFVTVEDNSQLTKFNLSGYVALAASPVMVNVAIRGNNNALAVSFPDMNTAALNVNGVHEFDAPELTGLGAADDSSSQSISQNSLSVLDLSKVINIAGILEIEDNPLLETLDLSALTTVTSLRITGNPKLRSITLPVLRTIKSSLYIDGPIDSFSAPLAQNVLGNVTILTTGSLDCNSLGITQSNGSPSCNKTSSGFGGGANGSGSPTPTSAGQAGGNSNGGGLSSGAKIGIGVGVGVGGLLIIGAIIFICCARRRKQRQRINPRSAGANEYYMEPKKHERSPARYTKVAHSGSVDHGSVDHSSEDRVSPSSHFAESHLGESRIDGSRFGENWSPPEQKVPTADGRVELEEQQGMRHEMDARSLQDMDLEDDREETRSLEDIERTHGQT